MLAYNLKLYPNKQKEIEINKLLSFWRDQVNHYIAIFWNSHVFGKFPPKELAGKGSIGSIASLTAWQIIKRAKRTRQKNRPIFNKNEIALFAGQSKICDFQTKEFDIWFSIISLNSGIRLLIPAKKHSLFNEAIAKGYRLHKSFKLRRIADAYYMQVYFSSDKKPNFENERVLGVDVGLNNPIVISDGKFLGKELKALRIKTKHRKYKHGVSATKQRINSYAKQLAKMYPATDFVFEDLNFKGKHKRSKEYRRRNNNWPYRQLANRMEQLALLKCFRVALVDPRDTSRTCPECGSVSEENRHGDSFCCVVCGFKAHADVVGAINIGRKSIRSRKS